MHPNPAYRQTSHADNLAFARDRGFGSLAVNGAEGPMIAHVPFLLDDAGDRAELHLVRSNPIAPLARAGLPAVIAVTGPDGYVSPDWYGLDEQVPTWNYIAVHLRGTLEPLPAAELRPLLDRLSAAFEARLAPKPPWRTGKMPADTLARMMRQILPFRLRIASVDGTWKLAQNKPETARLGAAEGVEAAAVGSETAALARAMRAVRDG